MAYYAGVDLGATHVEAVVGDGEGDVVGRDRRETPQGPSGSDVSEAVLGAVRAACSDAAVDPDRLRATGVGSIGPLDLGAGAVLEPANLPDGVDRIPLTGPLEDLVGRVYLHNDATAGLIGERFYREGNPDNAVYLTISSGIGAGVCVDGHLLSGVEGNAGEVGHLALDMDGRMRCGCGRRGHWEAYCSGTNIPRYATHLHEQDPVETALPVGAVDSGGPAGSDETAEFGGPAGSGETAPPVEGQFDAADVFALADEDPLADRVLDRVARWNALGVASIVHAYAPAVIYVGGAVALNNPELVLDPVRDRLPDLVMADAPDIERTTLGDRAVVKGALASALTNGTGDRQQGRY